MDYNQKYIILKDAGLIDETDNLLLYCCDRTIIQQIKNKRRRLNNMYDNSNNKVKLIQNNIKHFLIIQQFKDFSSQYKNPNINYQNNYTLLGDELKNVPKFFFYKYCELNSQYYGFDIRSLNQLLKINNKNPYTLIDFPKSIILQINRIIKNLVNNHFDIIIPSIIPNKSKITAILTSTYNKMKFLNIYPDIDKLVKFNITFLFYYIQDIMTNPLLETHINKNIYNQIIDIYNITTRTRLTKTMKKIHKDKMLLYILKIINHILDITDDYQQTRALAINEIIYNNNEIFGDNASLLPVPPAPPAPPPPPLRLPSIVFNLPLELPPLPPLLFNLPLPPLPPLPPQIPPQIPPLLRLSPISFNLPPLQPISFNLSPLQTNNLAPEEIIQNEINEINEENYEIEEEEVEVEVEVD